MARAVLGKIATTVAVVLLVALVAFVGKAWYDSRIPGTYGVMDYGWVDDGGGSPVDPHAAHAGGVPVTSLHGPSGMPDERFELKARTATIRLASGRTVNGLTFTGSTPGTPATHTGAGGPELRVQQGDLVEVVLRNEDVDDGVTIHWHGVDVPNAEDGVAGVTQDAVPPGRSHTYRFRAEQVGTFWYHSHQVSSVEVQQGLYGALVIEPRVKPVGVDLVGVAHTFEGIPTLNGADSQDWHEAPVGKPVRIRLVNTDSVLRRFTVTGTSFRVLAIDGTDLHRPGSLRNVALPLAAGGRIDIGYAQPGRAVRVGIDGARAALALSPRRRPVPRETPPTSDFDPLTYGEPASTPVTASSPFDRSFTLEITQKLGFFDGRPGRQWAINGGIYPDVPVFAVEEGDLVKVTISNDTKAVHPMHLHGHHALVLSANGQPSTGSPWWVDTLNVDPGDDYVVAFRADNPGVWMDHCHNLGHAAAGLTMHLAYAGVTTPFLVGAVHHNQPE
jgi:FtsP/CotA-like multicopper oxidase with cupredoxin domain